MVIEQLEKRWRESGRLRAIHSVMSLEEDGLVLGAGTVLSPREPGDADRLMVDGNEPRVLTLLSVAYGRPIDASILGNIRRASRQWSAGDDCLAAMHLALSGLQKLDDARDAARRLFIADGLMADGVEPRVIWTALEFDTASLDGLEKFNSAEPRVPKGSGRISGDWTTEWGEASAENIAETVVDDAIDISLDAAITFVGTTSALLLATTRPAGTPPIGGQIPGRPDLRYTWTEDEGKLRIYRGANPNPVEEATLGPKRSLITERQRKLGYLRATEVEFDLEALPPEEPSPYAEDTRPQPCPNPGPDKPSRTGKQGEEDKDYEDFNKARINTPPTPRGIGYALPNPVDDKPVTFDDCQHATGTLFEFKANYVGLLSFPAGRDGMSIDWSYQATRQVEASQGRPIEWDFADEDAADLARQEFSEYKCGCVEFAWNGSPGHAADPLGDGNEQKPVHSLLQLGSGIR